MIPKGIYRHFKGELYNVIDMVWHSETGEKLVLYHPVKTPDKLWVRPLDMFTEIIERDNKQVKRFEWTGDISTS